MRVLILGGLGMLGHKLCQVLSPEMDVWATVRRDAELLRSTGILESERIIEGVDAQQTSTVRSALLTVQPDVVVNCIGIVKQLPEAQDAALSIEINALLPHRLANLCSEIGAYLIHISTDCVFSGRRGNYADDDLSDAIDLYGRTKALGEILRPRCLTLRTSIIGRELRGQHGLIEWFVSQKGQCIQGYTHAIFSGLTTHALSELIGALVVRERQLEGLYNVASKPINKYDLLNLVKSAYSLSVGIEPSPSVVIDRSLDGDRFLAETGMVVKGWDSMLSQLALDPFDYDEWRGAHDA
jgi:dTDP-4-dehydrorhamnose reductase